MKNLLSTLAFIAMLIVLGACTEEDPRPQESYIANEESRPAIVIGPDPECNIVGTNWDGEIMDGNEQRTFSIEQATGATYTWVSNGPVNIISGANSHTVTVEADCNQAISTGELFASRVIQNVGICSNQGVITVLGGCTDDPPCDCIECPNQPGCENPPLCVCPNPSIDILTCRNTNGFLLAKVDNVESGDSFEWSAIGATVQNGKYSQNVAIYTPASGDITIKCKVTRSCGTSSKSKTVQWYTNNPSTCSPSGTSSSACSTSGGGGGEFPG